MLFRHTNDEDLLTQVGTTINEAFTVDFAPTLLLIVTWDRVPTFTQPSFVCLLNIIIMVAIVISIEFMYPSENSLGT